MLKNSRPNSSVTAQPLSESRARVLGFGYCDPLSIKATLQGQFRTPCVLVPEYRGQPGHVVLALSGAELVHNMDRLDGASICVFDRPDKLVRLSGVRGVDFFFEDEIYRIRRFVAAALDPAKFPELQSIALTSIPRDILKAMLDKSDNGVLNGILTFLYTIKNTKVRKDVSETVYPWFFQRDRSIDWLFDQLEGRFPTVEFGPMMELFAVKIDLIEAVRAAADTYSLRQHPDFRAFCEQQGVPFYDLHYLVKVVGGSKNQPPTNTTEA